MSRLLIELFGQQRDVFAKVRFMGRKPKEQSPLDLKKLGIKLRKLREEKFPRPIDLTKESGVPPQTIELTELGERHIRIDLLKHWLDACGTTLAAFFADFDNLDQKHVGHEPHHRLLTELLKTENDFYIKGIYANLRGMLIAAQVEDRSKQQGKSTVAEDGNLASNEKKKSGKQQPA